MKQFRIKSIRELNLCDDYMLNSNVELNGYKGKLKLEKGTIVKFVAIGKDEKTALISHQDIGISDISIDLLNSCEQSLVGRIVSFKYDIFLNSHRGEVVFERKVSKFIVESVFDKREDSTGNMEKRCFVRYLRDGKYSTDIVGDAYFYFIEDVKEE